MERCIVCLTEVPKSSLRRRLNSASSKHVASALHGVGSRAFNDRVPDGLLPNTDDTFVCRPCFRNVEKLLRLKREVSELELELTGLLKRSGEERGLRSPHQATASVPQEGCPVTTPTRQQVRAAERTPRLLPTPSARQVLMRESRPTAHVPPPKRRRGLNTAPCRPVRTPTRQQVQAAVRSPRRLPMPARRSLMPESLDNASPKRRPGLDTPCRQFLQQTHVTGSPAVAVSKPLDAFVAMCNCRPFTAVDGEDKEQALCDAFDKLFKETQPQHWTEKPQIYCPTVNEGS